MNYIVNIAKPKEVQVVIKTMEKGSAFSINSSYTVALNSSRARGEGGHLEAAGITKEMAKEKLVAISEKDVMYYLMKEIQKYRIIELSYDNNWLVIPALWSTKGMENSYPKLFGEMLK
jgi:2',3'-cyclic-nucleotide 2'-phosphodiesterase/3'-nucleotidase